MAVSASISSSEIQSSLSSRYVGNYFEAALINAPTVTYLPGQTDDGIFLASEVVMGLGGYDREVFNYAPSDLVGYTDRNIALRTKVTTFPHDGNVDQIVFTHVALLWGTGNTTTLAAATSEPSSGNDGVYTNFTTTTTGSGTGMILTLTISNDVFVYTIVKPGRNYVAGDPVSILASDMISAGAIESDQTLNSVLPVDTVSTTADSGSVIAVVQPSDQVGLSAGNEASFYWNLRLYGAS